MAKYIDKSALVAEIERRINEINLDTIEDWRYRLQREHDIEVMKNILSLINTLEVKEVQEEPISSIWNNSSEMPKEKKVCLIRYSANDGASTNNFEVVIAEPLTRRFVTRSYPHKTGYQHTIHGENTIKVDEYQDRREYIPFSDIDEWAYIDDLLNLSNVERTVKNWKEPVSEDFEEALAMEWQGYNDRGAATVDALEDNTQELAFAKGFYRGAKWQKAKLPKWKNKPLGGGCWSGEISVDSIRRLYRYEHYTIDADKLFKLLDKEE